MTYGINPTGFTKPSLTEIQAEWKASLLSDVDPNLDLDPDQPFGQIVAIASQREAVLWEVIETLANATNPNATEDFLLDALCALTGTDRNPATKTIVYLDCVVTSGFTATAGQMMANVAGHPETRFVNAFDVGPFPAGTQSIEFQATEYGPIVANAGTVTVKTAPVSGWTSCTNPLDGDTGSLRETDVELNTRRQTELSAPGSGTVDSIRADMLEVDGVEQCFVFENTTLATDSNGLPPKSFEVVVFDGLTPSADNTDIAQLIWDAKPAGIETYGTISEYAVDTFEVDRLVKFSRATVKDVWLEFDISYDANTFPADGSALIEAAVASYADRTLNLGIDVIANKMKAAALLVPGVIDVTALRLGLAAAPVTTSNILITGREIASVDTARITVALTPGTP